MRRYSRFGRVLPFVQQNSEDHREEIMQPSFGLHVGVPAHVLAPGFTPYAQNLMVDEGYLTPRSGLSSAASSIGTTALGAFRMFDAEAHEYALACSQNSIFVLGYAAPTWQEISYQKPASSVTNLPGGSDLDYWQGAGVYEPGANAFIAVMTNGVDLPKVAQLGASIATYSDHTAFASLASSAKAVCAFDNRLVFANVGEAFGNKLPQRVLWTPRGLPLSMSILAGAGFEDLMDLRGEILALVPERDGLLVFTSEEIWRGRRRGDAYAFTWYPVDRDIGCPFPRTIVSTPVGVLFLSRDYEMYSIVGDAVSPIGPALGGGPSRVKDWLQGEIGDPRRCHASYSPVRHTYQLHYARDGANHANAALWLNLDNGSWLPQTYAIEISATLDLEDPGDPGPVWDDFGEETWDSIASSWDAFAIRGAEQLSFALSSAGTSYVYAAPSAESYVWKWRSHGMRRKDAMMHDHLREIWFDYKNASDVSVAVSGDLGASFETPIEASFSGETYGHAFVPVNATAVSPMFELRGSSSSIRIGTVQAKLRQTSIFGGGF